MEYTIKRDVDAAEVRFSGRLTFADQEAFRGLLSVFDEVSGGSVVFDLDGLDFVDSSGLGMFIIARDAARRRSVDFTMRGARDEVKRLIEVARFGRLFNLAD